ncbi:hypothetical protein [Thermococcus peptonophilus]|uniref:hypothetical protein n=1 Tax=Thermococcus peptonophilus TaxID=53952 RepID=UPI000AC2E7FA
MNYKYVFQVVRTLRKENYLTVVPGGKLVILDRKGGLIFRWAKDKEIILNSLSR